MARAITDEQYGRLCARLDDFKRRVKEGNIPFREAMSGIQGLITRDGVIAELTVDPGVIGFAIDIGQANESEGWVYGGKLAITGRKAIYAIWTFCEDGSGIYRFLESSDRHARDHDISYLHRFMGSAIRRFSRATLYSDDTVVVE